MIQNLDEARTASVAVAGLGLDPQAVGIDSPEALAAALRRAASFLCPTTARRLVKAVASTLEWLVLDPDTLDESLSGSLDALINYGDLLELSNVTGRPSEPSGLILGPPTYIVRRSGSVLLAGIRSEGQPIVGDGAIQLVEYERHVRSIPPTVGDSVIDSLVDYGLRHLSIEAWLKSPRPMVIADFMSEFDQRLDAASDAGVIEGITIIDPAKPVAYYRGRWRTPVPRDRGRFVARRPRAYGADLWCYAELENGTPRRLIDLPLAGGVVRGCDEAWRLQAAIDNQRGQPQTVRIRHQGENSAILQLFAPPPSWLQRRWDALGIPVSDPGALVSYRIDSREVEEEVQFLATMLWMTQLEP